MGKKLELMWNIGKNTPTALYELVCGLSIVGGALALPVAGAIYLSGHPETAKHVVAAGGLGICGGGIAGFFRCIPHITVGLMEDNEYKADLMEKQSFASERIVEYIYDYGQEMKGELI